MTERIPPPFRAGGLGLRTGAPRVNRKDRIVQSTDMDALSSKYSAYQKGYISDPYLETIVQGAIQHNNGPNVQFPHKLPVINIGSSVRHFALNELVQLFLEPHESCQIVSLGAGSDTRAFSVLDQHNRKGTKKIIYHELDFEVTTKKKVRTILESPVLSKIVYGDNQPPPAPLLGSEPAEIHTNEYHLHACDLRTLSENSSLLTGLDPALPTLVLSECCLCYLQPEESDHVFAYLTHHLTAGLGVVLYEPIGGGDSFGDVMIENLATRGISLPTLKKYATLQSQVDRLAERGMAENGSAVACDMMYIYENWISASERSRIARLEFLDEIEELSLLLKHYCVAWTVSNGNENWTRAFASLPSQVHN